jgi:hypothetical protein
LRDEGYSFIFRLRAVEGYAFIPSRRRSFLEVKMLIIHRSLTPNEIFVTAELIAFPLQSDNVTKSN